jgi:3-methyladenine DNA glycosylase AlkD
MCVRVYYYLWEKRISIIATFFFISNNIHEHTLKISEILLKDKHDLIHKAVGWALREVGKKDKKAQESFLKKYYKKMPRTMLRYAIEKFPEKERKAWLKK